VRHCPHPAEASGWDRHCHTQLEDDDSAISLDADAIMRMNNYGDKLTEFTALFHSCCVQRYCLPRNTVSLYFIHNLYFAEIAPAVLVQ